VTCDISLSWERRRNPHIEIILRDQETALSWPCYYEQLSREKHHSRKYTRQQEERKTKDNTVKQRYTVDSYDSRNGTESNVKQN